MRCGVKLVRHIFLCHTYYCMSIFMNACNTIIVINILFCLALHCTVCVWRSRKYDTKKYCLDWQMAATGACRRECFICVYVCVCLSKSVVCVVYIWRRDSDWQSYPCAGPGTELFNKWRSVSCSPPSGILIEHIPDLQSVLYYFTEKRWSKGWANEWGMHFQP